MRSRWYPGAFQIPIAGVFGLVVDELLTGPAKAHDNAGTALMWVLWWPLPVSLAAAPDGSNTPPYDAVLSPLAHHARADPLAGHPATTTRKHRPAHRLSHRRAARRDSGPTTGQRRSRPTSLADPT